MQELIKEAGLFSTVIGRQKLKNDCVYEKSVFTFEKKTDNGVFLYNTFSGMLLFLTLEEFSYFKSGKLTNNVAKYFAEHWFLVPDSDNNYDLYKKYIGIVRPIINNGIIQTYTVMTTTDCNARCYYCYQNGIEKASMTLDTAKQVAEFITKNSGGQMVHIRWFGGEPLYNSSVIDEICSILKQNNVKFYSSMITNAYLFDTEKVIKAKKLWNLTNVQVTLDGTKNVYNATKSFIYINDDNPFDKVLNNIKNLASAEIRVRIRLNIGLKNTEDLTLLVGLLSEVFGENKYISVYAVILYDLYDALNNNDAEWSSFRQKVLDFKKYVCESGLVKETLKEVAFSGNNCMADDDSKVVISPNGELCKCEHYSKDDVIGDIWNGILNSDKIKLWKQEYFLPDCETCAFLPKCNHLVKCENNKRGCNEFLRQLKMLEYGRYIINTAEKIK